MSTKLERAPVETPEERGAPIPDLHAQGEPGQPRYAKTVRRLSIEMSGLALAVVATLVMYVRFIVFPVAHEPLNEFLILAWGTGVAIHGYSVYGGGKTTEAQIEREMKRLP
jgi:hypothetical protein